MIRSNKIQDSLCITVNRGIKIFETKEKTQREDWKILIYNIIKPPQLKTIKLKKNKDNDNLRIIFPLKYRKQLMCTAYRDMSKLHGRALRQK